MMYRFGFLALGFMGILVQPVWALKLVEQGQARAVIVMAKEPSSVATLAADELALHVKKATGVSLRIVDESNLADDGLVRVYVGDTAAARKKGMNAADLEPDTFILRQVDDDLYVLGKEKEGPPSGGGKGTLYGVYELLQRYMGVRWLWPGELGTYVPKTDTLTVDDKVNLLVKPALRFRIFRHYQISEAVQSCDPKLSRLGFSREGLDAYRRDLEIYLRRHRVGYTEPKPMVGHYFAGWWKQFGASHPDWFMQREDGQRGPQAGDDQHHVPMCVSNPDLHRYIVEKVWDGGNILRLGEVDRRLFCCCPRCREWDAPIPDAPDFARKIYNPMASNRYARFWLAVQKLAAKRNPNVTITTFLYWNYLPAPDPSIRLNKRIYGEFVPWGQPEITFFPMKNDAFEWLKNQWMGWKQSGITMAYRPNHFHGGYVMPHFSTRQAGEFFRFAAANGMVGFDFDSLFGHWATKGPMLYVYMRLSEDPTLTIQQIREEYFSAVGPAAKVVERYFDYWEDFAAKRPGSDLINPVDTHIAYPPEVFPPAQKILDDALRLACSKGDEQCVQRVEFLAVGLEHARLAAAFWGNLNGGRPPLGNPKRLREAQEALKKLIAFRYAHENLYYADIVDSAKRENRRTDIDFLLQENIEKIPTARAISPWDGWAFRKDVENVGQDRNWYAIQPPEEKQWQKVDVPSFWSRTSVGDYQGYGWYRTTFTLPESLRGKKVNLLFEAVDEQAWVYLNGKLIGEHTTTSEKQTVDKIWDRPFTIPVSPEQLNQNGKNVLVVRIHNALLAGGIWGSVYLYEPVKPDGT